MEPHTIESFNGELRSMFGRFGFINSPLSDNDIKACFDAGLTLDEAYGVACDYNCGFTFTESLIANYPDA